MYRKPVIFGYSHRRTYFANIPGFLADLFLIFLVLVLIFGFIEYARQFFGPYNEKVEIDLSVWRLPLYTFFSFSRGMAAYFLSLIFSLLLGFWAAKDWLAEKIVIPILDVCQSIPFLGFLPGLVLMFIGIFKKTNVGLELAAIIIMFTGQVWNMAFSVYHSIRTVPEEKKECATIYGFSAWQKIKWVEIPFATLSLSWNSVMSMAGGWFLLMVNEAFKLGDRDFQLPGLGSYMSVAAQKGDVFAMIAAVVAMILLIVILDQLLWSPIISWSQKFRIEETGPPTHAHAWFLMVLKNSRLIKGSCKCSTFVNERFQDWKSRKSQAVFQNKSILALQSAKRFKFFPFRKKKLKKDEKSKETISITGLIVSRIFLILLFGLLIAAGIAVVHLLDDIHIGDWATLCYLFLLTFIRVLVCILISLLVAVPMGLLFGLSEKAITFLEPFIQVAASFPATLLFPVFILVLNYFGISLAIGSVVLMLMGSFWYVFLNVIAGAKAMPSDLKEVAMSFQLSTKQRFFWLDLPVIFPYLIVGVMTGTGGAWNASIISEYVHYKNEVQSTPGIGSAISLAAQNNDTPLLTASILVLSFFVVIINFAVWARLNHYSEKKFTINN